MKSTKKHFTLDVGEYVMTANHHTARDYEIFYDGKKLNDVVGVIRIKIGE